MEYICIIYDNNDWYWVKFILKFKKKIWIKKIIMIKWILDGLCNLKKLIDIDKWVYVLNVLI